MRITTFEPLVFAAAISALVLAIVGDINWLAFGLVCLGTIRLSATTFRR